MMHQTDRFKRRVLAAFRHFDHFQLWRDGPAGIIDQLEVCFRLFFLFPSCSGLACLQEIESNRWLSEESLSVALVRRPGVWGERRRLNLLNVVL